MPLKLKTTGLSEENIFLRESAARETATCTPPSRPAKPATAGDSTGSAKGTGRTLISCGKITTGGKRTCPSGTALVSRFHQHFTGGQIIMLIGDRSDRSAPRDPGRLESGGPGRHPLWGEHDGFLRAPTRGQKRITVNTLCTRAIFAKARPVRG